MFDAMNTKSYKFDDTPIQQVNEAISAYFTQSNISLGSNYSQNKVKFPDLFENKFLLVKIIREGLPFTLFNKIKKITPFSEDEWANYLNISKKTLQRHKEKEGFSFKPIHTEKIIELAEVTNFGKEVFDSTEQFYLWLNTASFALGNLKPRELLKDSYGKELVMAELNRINHGVFA